MKFYIKCPECQFKLSSEMEHAMAKGECPGCGKSINTAKAAGVLDFMETTRRLQLPLSGKHLMLLSEEYFKKLSGFEDLPVIIVEEDMSDAMTLRATQPQQVPITAHAPGLTHPPYQVESPAPVNTGSTTEVSGEITIDPALLNDPAFVPAAPSAGAAPVAKKIIRPAVKGVGDDPDRVALIVNQHGLIATDTPTNVHLTPADLELFKTPGALPIMPITKIGNPNKGDQFTEKVPGMTFVSNEQVKAMREAAKKGISYSAQEEERYAALDAKAAAEAAAEASQVIADLSSGNILNQAVAPALSQAASSGSGGSTASSVANILNSGHTVHDTMGRPVTLPRVSNPATSKVMISDISAVMQPSEVVK